MERNAHRSYATVKDIFILVGMSWPTINKTLEH